MKARKLIAICSCNYINGNGIRIKMTRQDLLDHKKYSGRDSDQYRVAVILVIVGPGGIIPI